MSQPACDLTRAIGHWLTRDLIAWPPHVLPEGLDPAQLDWTLHWAPNGGIDPWESEPFPWSYAPLTVLPGGLPADQRTRAPHLSRAIGLRVPESVPVDEALSGQVALVIQDASGRLINACGLQIAGALDDLYAAAVDAELGITWHDGRPTLRVWAPTAHHLDLHLWPPFREDLDEPQVVAMTRTPDGCYEVTGEPSWVGYRYLYAATVFAPSFQRVVTNQVTDPYSVALTANSTHSVIADLADPKWAPREWLEAPQPRLDSPVQQVIYELHVRDFSRADKTLPDEVKGTFAAFAEQGLGRRHLARLAAAGLNTVQLLPIFDCTSIEEDRSRQWRHDTDVLRAMPPDSDEQQAYLQQAGHRRPFNWGYDPWHYMVPEGGYATTEAVEGAPRIAEARTMIGALHGLGLRVVLDQVYNHTTGEGQSPNSVLGRLVPGYYHRREVDGEVATSTCCPNVATEHLMAEKMMVDSCVLWAKHYKVDGFRFDLMGHHSRSNMLKVRAALDALTIDDDGVDGHAITMHGEGWNFGEVANNAFFIQASQGQLGGTGIGTFSDRLRDAVRGGLPFDNDPRLQGFGTGLVTDPNESARDPWSRERTNELNHDADLIALGMAGNLRAFVLNSAEHGRPLRGDELRYGGAPAGYADEPDEVVNYVDAHDNETLFDALTLKLPIRTPMSERVRANTVCLAFPTLGQSPVMWHAGSDFLRSKSLDRNSYDSGDWFNYLDFSMRDNGFGAGLPPASDNAASWPYMRPLLAQPGLKPTRADMAAAHEAACRLLEVRASSRLFTLGTAAAIQQKVTFPVSGTWQQTPGVIVMHLDDTVGDPVDRRWRRILVVINACPGPVAQGLGEFGGGSWELHPALAAGRDERTQTAAVRDTVAHVPGRTVAVFVEPR